MSQGRGLPVLIIGLALLTSCTKQSDDRPISRPRAAAAQDSSSSSQPFAENSSPQPKPTGRQGPSPTPSKTPRPEYLFMYPTLTLGVTQVDRRLYVGPVAGGRSGCSTLEATASGNEITVEGAKERIGAACTADAPNLWKPIEIPPVETIVSIVYRGQSGKYRVVFKDQRVQVDFISGRDVASPASHDGWWEIPDEALMMGLLNFQDEAALKRSADRLRLRLALSGSRTIVAPRGDPLVRVSSPSEAPGSQLYARRSDFESFTTKARIQELYLSGLEESELRIMANQEAELEHCTFVWLIRPHSREMRGGYGVPPCARTSG